MRTLALLALLTAVGCSPCEDSCLEQTRTFDNCLQDWELGWVDLGASSKTGFREQCISQASAQVEGTTEGERSLELGQCRRLARGLREATDCDGAWGVLVSYGVEP